VHQLELAATKKPGLSALSADAKAGGELKDVAALVYPEAARKDPEKARNDLSDGLRANHARKLDIDEAITIIVQAVERSNRSEVVEYIISRLPKHSCEFRWLDKQEKIERVTATLADMLPAFVEAVQIAQSLVSVDQRERAEQRASIKAVEGGRR
jgi:hypothetical protein